MTANLPIKIFFVVNNTGFFLSHRLPLALEALQRGYQVHLASARDGHEGELDGAGVIWHDLPLRVRSFNPVRDLVTLVSLWRLFRVVRPDLVHLVTIKPVLYGGLAARLAGVPALVSALSGLGFLYITDRLSGRLIRAMLRPFLRLALGHGNGRLILQNADDAALFTKERIVPPERIIIIRGSGADGTIFYPSPEPAGEPVVILPARLLKDKGVLEFCAAAARLRSQGVKARFLLLGAPDTNNPNTLTSADLDAIRREGVVELKGVCRDMPGAYRDCHIVCLPSYREGLPKSLIEAAASGRPIVATDVPGCREIVRDGVNGLLTPPRNRETLAAALQELIEDRDVRQRMGERGREIFEKDYQMEKVTSLTFALYESLLPSGKLSN